VKTQGGRWETELSTLLPARHAPDRAQPSMLSDRPRRVSMTVAHVVSDPDLVCLILRGNVGVSAFGSASLVCKVWLHVCRSDMRLLRGVALYTDGLTKGAFMKLFAVSSSAADALPRTTHKRYGGGNYFLYRQDAVDAILADGGMASWHHRMRTRAASSQFVVWPFRPAQPPSVRGTSGQEERLRARAEQRREWRRIRAS
jgi:hypothetical protein